MKSLTKFPNGLFGIFFTVVQCREINPTFPTILASKCACDITFSLIIINHPPLRCKFPKTVDAVHELQLNRAKKRTAMPLVPIPEAVLAASAGANLGEFELRRELFIQVRIYHVNFCLV
jgi:hypothetical protein